MTPIQNWFKQTEIWLIPEDWELVELGELWKVVTWKTPSTSDKENFWWDIPFLKIPNMNSRYENWTNEYISTKWKESVKNLLLPKWSIAVSCIATIWKVCITTKNETLTNQQINSIIPNERVFNLFLYYRLLNFENILSWFWWWWAVFDIISKSKFEKISVSIPPLPEQKAIAEILSSLDDKIELLEKQNKTLENIGQALFKSWFVDFEGFENDLVESEMGMIPRGWKFGKVGDFTNIFTWRKNVNQANQEWEYRFFSCSPDTFFSDEFLYDWKAVLIAWNGSFTWRVAYYKWKFDLYQRTYAVVKKDDIKFEFMNYLYFVMKYKFEPVFMWWSRGSSIPYIVMWDIANFEFFIPKQEKLAEFENIIDWFFDKIEANNLQIQTLSNLRDSVLPRLMSGKIRPKI